MADGGRFHGARAPMEFAVCLKFAGPEIDSFPLICPDADQRARSTLVAANQSLPSFLGFKAIFSVRSFFDTLPKGERGKSSMISKRSGNLCFAISSVVRNDTSCSRVKAAPRRRITQAHMRSPSVGSGIGTQAAFWTAG